MEAHERWSYDDKNKIQKLVRIVALCHQCHQSTHMGLAGIRGKEDEAIEHFKSVRGFTDKQLAEHRKCAGELHIKRSKTNWELDISLITNAGINAIQIPKKEERNQIMRSELNKLNDNITSNGCSCCRNPLCYLESSYDWECDLCQTFNLKTTKHMHCVSCETDICCYCYDKTYKSTNTEKSKTQTKYANLNGHRIPVDLFDNICKHSMENALRQDLIHNMSRYERARQEIPFESSRV